MSSPVVLAILDGWGLAPDGPGNPLSQANLPNYTAILNSYPNTRLVAHGDSVGLPKKEPGNTETGHLNIGAGRIVYQDLPRINMSIADGTFFTNDAFLSAINHAKEFNSKLHIIALVSSGSVHSDLAHVLALFRLCHEQNFSKVFLHAITDGRDSPPSSSITYLSQIERYMQREQVGQIASIMGRYYAMDRDLRWDRTEKAYFCLTRGIGASAPSVDQAIATAYSAGLTDEFIPPTIISPGPLPTAIVQDSDSVIFANFRIDRPRQLTKAFVISDFETSANTQDFDPYWIKYHNSHLPSSESASEPFDRKGLLANLFFVTMTEYERNLPVVVAFPPQRISEGLGETLSRANLTQLRLAESEKERFVTFYFNGQIESPFPGEDRQIVPSPKVATYDLAPQMSAKQVTQIAVDNLANSKYSFMVINYANPDMVGHTGNIPAAITACETIDECLGQLVKAVLAANGVLVITADHGNVEQMLLPEGGSDTEHNSNDVPFIVVANNLNPNTKIESGILADIAPTILNFLAVPKPKSMTGRILISL